MFNGAPTNHPPVPKSSSSFLDDWLKKKQAPRSSSNSPMPTSNSSLDRQPTVSPVPSRPPQPVPSPFGQTSTPTPTSFNSLNPSNIQTEPLQQTAPNKNDFTGEFKIPQKEPSMAQVDDTIFIDDSGNLSNSKSEPK